jgi:hypothetical protein
MTKPLVGILAGAVLGFFDGLTAWFTPEVRSAMMGILIGSSIKGMLVGVASGFLARKVHSIAVGISFGAALGLLLAYAVAAMPQPDGRHYYLEIMLPGFIVGALIGFMTQRLGTPAAVSEGATHAKANTL